MTNLDIETITGHLLGDGSIFNTNPNKNKMCVFAHLSKHKEYIEWVINNITYCNGRPIWSKNYLDKRTNKNYQSWWFRSLSNKDLTNLRKLWYPDGVKTIPRNLKLTPYILKVWFMDDGSLATKGGIYLATDGFQICDIDFLIELLISNLNLEATKHKNDSHYRIYIPKSSNNKFFDIIGKCPVKCFEYKWNK